MSNDEETKPLTVDMKLDLILTRLAALEAKSYDTKPIWERALAEILEVKQTLNQHTTRLARIENIMSQLTSEYTEMRIRVRDLEASKPL